MYSIKQQIICQFVILSVKILFIWKLPCFPFDRFFHQIIHNKIVIKRKMCHFTMNGYNDYLLSEQFIDKIQKI